MYLPIWSQNAYDSRTVYIYGCIYSNLRNVNSCLHELYTFLPKCTAHTSKFDTRSDSTTLDLPYDYESIMQFSHNAYSKNGLPTIMTPINIMTLKGRSGEASWPSKQDYLDLNLYYCGEMIEVKHKTSVYAIRKCFNFILLINAYNIYVYNTNRIPSVYGINGPR